jgi:hypothetical protein
MESNPVDFNDLFWATSLIITFCGVDSFARGAGLVGLVIYILNEVFM